MSAKKPRPIPMLGYVKKRPDAKAKPAQARHREALNHAEEVFTVASQGVDRMAYDHLTETVFVTWVTGKTYAYEDFPVAKWEAFKDAASKGKYANFAIKYQDHECFGPI
jgi:hypothetical protein